MQEAAIRSLLRSGTSLGAAFLVTALMAKACCTSSGALHEPVSLIRCPPAASATANATAPGPMTCHQLKKCTNFCALQACYGTDVLALAAVPYADTLVIALSTSGIPVPPPDVLALAAVPTKKRRGVMYEDVFFYV